MTTPRVSVIVPHYRDLAGLDLCLSRLVAQTYDQPYEIVVADNNSPEGKAAVASVVGDRARLVIVTEQGAGPARNGGVAAAKGEILAFTDSDCVPSLDWLANGVSGLDRGDIVGGRVDVAFEADGPITASEAFEVIFGFNNRRYIEKMHFSVTANLICSKAVFTSVGDFLPNVSEDTEWGQRAYAAGRKLVYVDSAVVTHPPRRSWAALLTKWRRIESETFELEKRNGRPRSRWLLRSLAMPFSAVVHSAYAITDKRLPLNGRLLAILMLFRIRCWRAWNGLRLLYSERPN